MNAVAVKIGYEGNLHRLRVDLNTFTLAALTHLFRQTFPLLPQDFVITYTDIEGDCLNVCSDAEFMESCRVFLSGNNDELKALKFTAIARGGTLSLSASPADGLIQAVERLVVTLNDAVEKAKEGEWKGMEGVAETLTQAAQDTTQTLEATRQAVQEKPFENVLEETSEGLKSAAVGISSFAQRFVKNFIPEKKSELEVNVGETPAVEETIAVHEPEVVVPPITTEEVELIPSDSIAFSDSEIRWAEELGMIRGIFPDLETTRAIEMLERAQGDMNIVLNALMEHM